MPLSFLVFHPRLLQIHLSDTALTRSTSLHGLRSTHTQPLLALMAISAPPAPSLAHDDSNDKTLNDRDNLNKAIGVDPTNRATVHARRKEVSGFCLVQFSVALNKPYSQWSAKTWYRVLNGVACECEAKYGWTQTKETAEAVMKSYALTL